MDSYMLIGFISAFFIVVIVWNLVQTHYVRIISYPIELDISSPIKVVHISDLHGKTWFINGRLSTHIRNLSPDIIVLTGDLVSREKQLVTVQKELEIINKLEIPIFFVLGNYEKEEGFFLSKRKLSIKKQAERIMHISKYANVLINEGVMIERRGVSISIYGFNNSTYGSEKNKSSPFNKADVKLLLAHSPSIYKLVKNNKIPFHLLLVGHTHGGQIRLRNRTLNDYKYCHIGLKKISGRQYFHITNGLGTVRIPVRIHCPPEIVVFNIQ